MAIISLRHNFIFVKTRKTAGTSIEVELSKILEPEAIVTPVIPPVEGHEPRNWRRGFLRKPYYNHMPATLIRSSLGAGRFDRMFRFCVEREPVAKCISHFHMLKNSEVHGSRTERSLTWDDYCARGDFPIDVEKYSEGLAASRVRLVDLVIPYETLNVSLRDVMTRIGIAPFDLNTKAKGEYSARRFIRKEDVTANQRETIYRAFAPSIAIAGLGDVYRL